MKTRRIKIRRVLICSDYSRIPQLRWLRQPLLQLVLPQRALQPRRLLLQRQPWHQQRPSLGGSGFTLSLGGSFFCAFALGASFTLFRSSGIGRSLGFRSFGTDCRSFFGATLLGLVPADARQPMRLVKRLPDRQCQQCAAHL